MVCKWNSPSWEQYIYLSIRYSYHPRMPYQSSHFSVDSFSGSYIPTVIYSSRSSEIT